MCIRACRNIIRFGLCTTIDLTPYSMMVLIVCMRFLSFIYFDTVFTQKKSERTSGENGGGVEINISVIHPS